MKFQIGGNGAAIIHHAICDLAAKSITLSIAVSYIQLSGWELLKAALTEQQIKSLRILCTDQLGITDPKAVREIMKAGAAIRVFTGNGVFHPKVFIGSRNAMSDLFLMGSANLSRSALITGVEADLAGEDKAGDLRKWFDSLFDDNTKSTDFDDERLAALEEAFVSRVKSRIAFKRLSTPKKKTARSVEASAEDALLMESVFAGFEGKPTPLNFDKAGNTVRQLQLIFDLLHGTRTLKNLAKQRNEMKLLGLAEAGKLTDLGVIAADATTINDLAQIWMGWLKVTSDAALLKISPSGQLAKAKKVFERFWTLPAEVTDYFILKSENPSPEDKKVLQTIELLVNARGNLASLNLDDISVLSTVLSDTSGLSPNAAEAINKYLNKGTRGWDAPDRRLAVLAWRDPQS
jgi:HKD family nuclease